MSLAFLYRPYPTRYGLKPVSFLSDGNIEITFQTFYNTMRIETGRRSRMRKFDSASRPSPIRCGLKLESRANKKGPTNRALLFQTISNMMRNETAQILAIGCFAPLSRLSPIRCGLKQRIPRATVVARCRLPAILQHDAD